MSGSCRSPGRKRGSKPAGKRGGLPSARQADISVRLIELARKGERVLRLKGGDPFVFARGGEEVFALAEAAIPFRVIAGVTAGLAGLVAATIPTTLRGVNQAIILATGHSAEQAGSPDWAALARTRQPLVLYMAMNNLRPIAEALIAGGLSAGTPAAIIVSATMPPGTDPGHDARAARRCCGRRGIRLAGDRRHRRNRRSTGRTRRRGAGGRTRMARALILAAAASGSGKTTVTTALLRAFRNRGVAVKPAKIGPDYIDPAFHAAAAGTDCPNLDSWAMAPKILDAIFGEAAQGADLMLIESAMGLFDGVPGEPGRTGSGADIAARYGIPVVLVVDMTGQAQTAAAVVRGLASHARDVRIAGVILNRVGSERHRAFVAMRSHATGIAVFGALPSADRLAFPSRHLGLVQAGEHDEIDRRLDDLADFVGHHVDLERTARGRRADHCCRGAAMQRRYRRPANGSRSHAMTPSVSSIRISSPNGGAPGRRSPSSRHSPTKRRRTGATRAGCPEAIRSSTPAGSRRHGISSPASRRFAESRPVHGECGGHMVLGRFLEDANGERQTMAGLLSHGTSFATRRLNLGYREARLLADGRAGLGRDRRPRPRIPLFDRGRAGSDAPLAELFDGQGRSLGPAGGHRGYVSGSYFHAIAPA